MSFNFINDLDTYLENKSWKYIDGYNDKYIITNKGEVISVGGKSNHNLPILLAKQPDKDGYLRVVLQLNKYKKTKRINILVAEAFIEKPNKEQGLMVNHIDFDVSNNCVENLEWVTGYQNYKHSDFRIKLEIPTVQLSLDGILINIFKSVSEAARCTGIGQGNITNCMKGRCKSVGGFKWKSQELYNEIL